MRRPLIVLAVLVTLLAGGCGIPENSDVTVLGAGPTSGAVADDHVTRPEPLTRESTTEPSQFVQNYLQAAAGDPPGALGRVKSFLTDDAARRLESAVSGPSALDVRVVRVVGGGPFFTPGEDFVSVDLQQVGVLRSNGVLEPASDPWHADPYKVYFQREPGRSGLFIKSGLPGLVMLDSALKTFYQQRTIYFWNLDGTALVPDVRYMPRSLPSVQQPTTILNWLVNGPAKWLGDAVQSLDPRAAVSDNVPAINNNTLQITLGAQAVPNGDKNALDRLRRQLQWSMRPLLPRTLELKIGRQDPVSFTDAEYLTSNRSFLLPGIPDRFAVLKGVVRRRAEPPHADDPIPVLKPADNKDIAAASMGNAVSRTFAAVVTAGKNPRLRVGSAPRGTAGDLKDVALPAGALGYPVWAVTSDNPAKAVGLITVNGRIYSFAGDGSAPQPVDWPGDPGQVTALSVAPDGVRVALVSGNRLYRAALRRADDALSLSGPDLVSPSTLSSVTAVAWSSEGWLILTGVDRARSRVTIIDMSADRGLQNIRLSDIGDKPVYYLTAYPANPIEERETSTYVSYTYTAGGVAYDALSIFSPINPANLTGVNSAPPAGAVPTSPFYLG